MEKRLCIIRNEVSKHVTVCLTDCPNDHVLTLERIVGCELSIVYVSPILDDPYAVELSIHSRFALYKHIGDWFYVRADKIINFLNDNYCF